MMSRFRCCSCILMMCFAIIVQFEFIVVSGAQLSVTESQDNYGVNNPTSGSLMNDRCLNCNADASKTCIGCKLARYCSKKCQKRDWKYNDHRADASKTCIGCKLARYCSKKCQKRDWKYNDHRSICPGKNEVKEVKSKKKKKQRKSFYERMAGAFNDGGLYDDNNDEKQDELAMFQFELVLKSRWEARFFNKTEFQRQLMPDQLERLEKSLNYSTPHTLRKIIFGGSQFSDWKVVVTQKLLPPQVELPKKKINCLTMTFTMKVPRTRYDEYTQNLLEPPGVDVLFHPLPEDIFKWMVIQLKGYHHKEKCSTETWQLYSDHQSLSVLGLSPDCIHSTDV
eukprot:828002_1